MKHDIQTYRTQRAASDIASLKNDIVDVLSNPHNIALWKNGIELPNYATSSDAYSHFHGFRNATIERATVLAHNGTDRFIANKVEQVLDPSVVQHFINSVDTAHEQIVRKNVTDFVEQRFKTVQSTPKLT